jgi:hypothetical protein
MRGEGRKFHAGRKEALLFENKLKLVHLCSKAVRDKEQKFFGSFFQKRTASCPCFADVTIVRQATNMCGPQHVPATGTAQFATENVQERCWPWLCIGCRQARRRIDPTGVHA